MSAHALLNLLNELRKRNKMRGSAETQDSIYHMTVKWCFICDFALKCTFPTLVNTALKKTPKQNMALLRMSLQNVMSSIYVICISNHHILDYRTFSCSAQLSMKFTLLINILNCHQFANNYWHFNINELDWL